MSWTRRQFHQHLAAVRLLDHVREHVFLWLRAHRRASEYQTQLEVLKLFARFGLRNEVERPIVAFRESTSAVHYYPRARGSLRLRRGTWILLDIWARLAERGAPYADLTWMAWYGGAIPQPLEKIFFTVRDARDLALAFVQQRSSRGKVPIGQAIDGLARRSIARAGFHGKFPHGLGHSLGFDSPHGKFGVLSPKNTSPLTPGVGYTIEPGVYLPGKFGARLEMDFFLTSQHEIIVTSELQQEIVRI